MEIIGEKYKIENKILGSGGFGDVYLGTNLFTHQEVAIKKIHLNKYKDKLNNLNSEIEVMKQLDHPNIVKYYDVFKTENYWYIVMELCNAGTLADVIKFNDRAGKEKKFNFNREANTYYYLNQLKNALNYIRSQGYVHRDIKPANVLLNKPTITTSFTESDMLFKTEDSTSNKFYFTEKLVVKLADFGFARYYRENEEMMMKSLCGSPLYMAPELFLEKKYNSKADLWSFGVVMYEMLFGEYPVIGSSFQNLVSNVKFKNINFHLNKNFTENCFDILTKLLVKDYQTRIDWEKFFKHEWFVQWERIIKTLDAYGRMNLNDNVTIPIEGNPLISSKTLPMNSSTDDSIKDPTLKDSMIKDYIKLTGPPASSPLGFSNLSKMKFDGYSVNSKMGNYADYPSSYPPIFSKPLPIPMNSSKNMNVSRSVGTPSNDNWKISRTDSRSRIFKSFGTSVMQDDKSIKNSNDETPSKSNPIPIKKKDVATVPSAMSYNNSPITFIHSYYNT